MKKEIRNLQVVSRETTLAQLQVDEVLDQLNYKKNDIQIQKISVKSFGDKNLDISLMDNPPADIFTRETDIAVLNGNADFSIHSAKDLPYPLHPELEVVAITKRADYSDSIITKNGVKLSELKQNPLIAASSPIRAKEIKKLRKDAIIKSVRGTIEQRISQINCGKYDALIVATCDLNRLGLNNIIAEKLNTETDDLQGYLAVVAKKGRADIKALFKPIDTRNNIGKVSLAGAGIGDYENVSLKVLKALKNADIVYYDNVLAPELLEFTNGDLIAVGEHKSKNVKSYIETSRLIYINALEGKNVVRLKGGDPMIFGRAGEEANYLLSRLVDVEILPGITSASAAASLYNIPITMKNEARSISFVTTHTITPEICSGDIEVPNTDTIVYYMGVTNTTLLKASLLNAHRNKYTKVAFVSNMGSVNEKIVISDIENLDTISFTIPAIIIVGDIVKHYRAQERVLYTGISTDNVSYFTKGTIIHYPVIKTEVLEIGSLTGGVKDLTDYEALIFTSKHGVNAFVKHYGVSHLFNKMIISIGDFTTKAINELGADIDFVPLSANSESLEELVASLHLKCFYPCSDVSINKLQTQEDVKAQILYKTVKLKKKKVDFTGFDSIFFSSSLTIDAYLHSNDSIPTDKLIYVMGEKTLAKAIENGVDNERIVNVQEIESI